MKKTLTFLILILLLIPNIVFARLPNDPYAEQWSFKDAKVYEAWDKATGSRDVVVAIIDNGFDTFHPDLYPNVWKNEDEIADNGKDDDKNGYIDDVWGWDFSGKDLNYDGVFTENELLGDNDPRPVVANKQILNDDIHHGTLVAGVIGAVGNNNNLGVGINWQVRLMNLQVLEVSGIGNLEPLARAIRYAVDNGADVINISLVGDVSEPVKEAVKYAYKKGVAMIAASGNDRIALNLSPVYPICADAGEKEQWVLGVSAIGEDHYLAPFSNVGSNCIDITAPGVNVSSTMRYSPRYGLDKKYGGDWQGTSFAAPFVSATAALIKSVQPTWGPKEIYEAILKSVHRTPPDDVAAYEEVYGAGLIQVGPAIDYALERAGVKKIKSILTADLLSGKIQEKENNTEIKSSALSALSGVDYTTSFADGFVTTRKLKYRNLVEVVIYDSDWQMLDYWWAQASGKLDVEVGDVRGDSKVEVILAPVYSSQEVLQIFDLEGKKLDSLQTDFRHDGVALGLMDVAGNKKEILAVYNNKSSKNAKLYHFDKDFTVVLEKELDFVRSFGQVAVGDIDADGVQEYVVGAGNNEAPFLAYYEKDGSLKRKFYAYDSAPGGFDLLVGDYDNDGKDDVIVATKNGGQKVRVWSDKSKKLAEWDIGSVGNFGLLAVYK